MDFSPAYRASPEWRALNPVGKMPVLHDGDLVMFESGAMVQYILDRYGQGRLQPAPGTPEHAIFLQWCWFAEATFARPLGEMVNQRRAFGDKAVPAVTEEMAGRAGLCLQALADELSDKPYLLGDEFSAADIMTGYSLMLARRLVPGDPHQALDAYWERLSKRPAFQRTLAHDASA